MFSHDCAPSRRNFLASTLAVTAGAGLTLLPSTLAFSEESDINIIGPKQGYSPQIGTLSSMMAWMRGAVLRSVQGMSQRELDFLLDDKANSVGALLMHLAATDRIYQVVTFENADVNKLPASYTEKWGVAMDLGDPARKSIKGNNLDYYVNSLSETREHTLSEFRRRDDQWLMTVDKTWPWGPTNNYCKWFHVCEHESNHNGQIKLIRKRIPGAKNSGE